MGRLLPREHEPIAELAAWEWRDVDRDSNVVHVRRFEADGRVKEPKTERRRRRVAVDRACGRDA
jgi:hypothetical protein